MTDPMFYITVAGASLAAIAMLSFAALRGWRGWLDLKHVEIQHQRADSTPPSAGSMIEMADLKERIRKLEAIAAGVDI
ncbi:MAG: hypothetical protein ABS87_09095 [Sphingomonas sp. SCN 67-18]|uniref:hypothetical protein n=1 Tax=uncultured Sphingomonas sp. TaxID=158754 RepID=UPI00086A5617|nr:hypothetical protein [Sphingomonas sp. SCN 67-18]ODU20840.1 MAG: hypothetical protein ABS87_09095 [Sphingomonas sp. SCN 67-18]